MIRVLGKAFGILERVAEAPEQPRPLGELASHIGVSDSSCAHLVKTLVHHGYLEKARAGRGYVLGPMAYFLPRNGVYRRDIVRVVQPLLFEMVRRIQEPALVATLSGERKYNLCVAESDLDIQVRPRLLHHQSVYQTATGRVLMAYLEDDRRQALLARIGLPAEAWPEAASAAALAKALEEIRRRELAVIHTAGQAVMIAMPLREGAAVIAALGVTAAQTRFTGRNRTQLLKAMRDTTEQMSQRLTAAAAPRHSLEA